MSSYEEKLKKFEKKTIKDNFIFSAVMQDPDKCKALLECILKIKIRKITYPEIEKQIKIAIQGKGVRLDVYVEDEKNTVYNIEMQTVDKKDLPLRIRYYQGMIDLNILKPGMDYTEAKQSYIIFICDYDEFGLGRHIYTFENVCQEVPTLKLNDGTIKMVLNTTSTDDDVDKNIKELLGYIGGDCPKSELTKMLDDEVKKVKSSEKWRREYMLLWERDQDNVKLGDYKRIVISCRDLDISQFESAAKILKCDTSVLEDIKDLIDDNPELDDEDIAQLYINQSY